MCETRRGRYRIIAANLCVTGPDRCVLRSFYATARNILGCTYSVVAAPVQTVRRPLVRVFEPLCCASTILQNRRGHQV